MKRNLNTIAGILQSVLQSSAEDGYAYFNRNMPGDDDVDFHMQLAVNAGFLAEQHLHPEEPHPPGKIALKVTWKGLCFLDLYEIYVSEPKESLRNTVAEIALLGL